MASRARGFSRIVHYYPRALVGDGGVTNSVRGWVRALSEVGANVAILHMGGQGTWDPPEAVASLVVPHRGGGRLRRTLRPHGLGSSLQSGDLLVLHSGWWLHNLVAGAAARRAGIPYIVVPHGAYDRNIRSRRRYLKAIWEPAETHLVRRAAAVHLFFESEAADLRKIAPDANMVIAPTGQFAAEWRWLGGGGYLAWMGRFDIEHKGLDLLAAALAEIDESERPKLHIAGTEHRNTIPEVMNVVRKVGMTGWVELTGPLYGEAKAEFLRSCEAYVYPSRWESYGMSVAEALAAGVPTVISSTMHIASTIQSAAISSDLSPSSLALAIRTALSDQTQLSKAGPELVAKEFDWDQAAQRWLLQVSSLIGQDTATR